MKLLLLLLPILLLSACTGIQVNYDYDLQEDFTHYATYRWGASDSSHDVFSANPLLKKNYMYIADSILTTKNYRLVEDSSTEVDFIVVLFGTVTNDTSIVTTTDATYSMGMGYGGYGGYGPSYGRVPGYGYNYGWYDPWYGPSSAGVSVSSPASSTTSLEVHKHGTLIYDVVNAKTNKLVWRGTAEKTLQNYGTTKKSDNVERLVVGKVFNNFPPPPKK